MSLVSRLGRELDNLKHRESRVFSASMQQGGDIIIEMQQGSLVVGISVTCKGALLEKNSYQFVIIADQMHLLESQVKHVIKPYLIRYKYRIDYMLAEIESKLLGGVIDKLARENCIFIYKKDIGGKRSFKQLH